MNLEEIRTYCLSKRAATEDFPFDETTLCFRVGGKIFAITDIVDLPLRINLKCDPEQAVVLREQFEEIIPGWHCNKKHWNTVYLDGSLDNKLIFELADQSYDLIFNSLKKAQKEAIINHT